MKIKKITKSRMKKIFSLFIFLPIIFSACAESSSEDKQTNYSSDEGLVNSSVNLTIEDSKQINNETMSNESTNTFDQISLPTNDDLIAILKTSKGEIKIRLFNDLVPETVNNFVQLAKSNKYDGVPFHRVIKGFMIQTGDFENKNGTGGYSYMGEGTVIADEFTDKLSHLPFSVSMANRGPNTGGSQFFIVSDPNGTPWLNNGHSVFGQVFEGQSVVMEIESVATAKDDRPLTEIVIESIDIRNYRD